ncbi:hypothetical protein PULV_a3799 [Pseudoalteromonas ulvae UL12]|uniref:tetratricopeptide repeat protein n=1 Tax=Pseudoalteromonas ulvae TaxID=107327 RepID=UPI00186BA18F|nr:tetratricopeptide repeat protein [Pseudoalteromonas ulvae]MBE0363192.1 hypothetical protein [Pseudoalteromonas ulvae UL12]
MLRCIKESITLVIALIFSSQVLATDTMQISSRFFTTPIDYTVTLPKGYHDEKNQHKRYYLHVDLHPRSHGSISQLNDWLSHNGEWPWPQTIIVTPTDYHSEFAAAFEQLGAEPTNPLLLDYLEQVLLTNLDKQYRTNGFRTYSGFMGNAALGLHILLNRPALFTGYILASPTLGENMFNINAIAETKLKTLDDRLRYVYISIGKHSFEKSHIAGVNTFKQTLERAAPQSLEWHVDFDTANNYMSRPIITLINGIEGLFADKFTPLPADSAISKQGADAIIAYYQRLSDKKYGFEVSAEPSLNSLATSFITDSPAEAEGLFKRIIGLYPESSYAESALAEFYSEQGQIEQAIAVQLRAVEKAKTLIQWHQNKQQATLERYQAQRQASDTQ